jgi:uncharacterized protein YndB with AHSA1/START domain
MNNAEYVYVTYIKTTPEKLWAALTTPEFTRQYWGDDMISDWKTGSAWKYVSEDDASKVLMEGEVLTSEPPNRLVFTWLHPGQPSDQARVEYQIERMGEMVRLTVIHDNFVAGSTLRDRISQGWPRVLSSLKTFLETGVSLDTWQDHTSTCSAPS